MVHRRHQRGVEQFALAGPRQVAAQHQPDHLGEGDIANQLLDGVAAIADLARLHVDDFGVPPVLRGLLAGVDRLVAHSARSCFRVSMSASA
jgi:hypothetical protein